MRSHVMRLRLVGLLLAIATTPLPSQTDGTCIPVAERGDRTLGCFITARAELGDLSKEPPLYWHLDTYATVAAAIEAKGPRGTVVQSVGRIWLFSIAPVDFRPEGGTHVARVGPLPLFDAATFAAVYMEGVFAPGMASVVHRHPGVEAWITLEGSMCLETPEGRLEQRAGDPGVMMRGGQPMQLTGTGNGPRRSIVLILQDATLPRSSPAHDWTPRGLCSDQGLSTPMDTMPANVVQRFVDAANARDAAAMAALVAPDAVFERFPGGEIFVQGRDSIRARYERLLRSNPANFHITVSPRVVEGQLVIDQEHFAGLLAGRNQSTWMYLVRNGLISRAWVLDGRPPTP